MIQAVHQFRGNLLRARELGNLARAVTAVITTAIDISDIWRAQIVLGVSALDHFIHEMARLGIIESAKGNRAKTDAYLRFSTPMAAVERALAGDRFEDWLSDSIRDRHSWLSFQHPDKIADAIRLISPVKLWEQVGTELGLSAADANLRLEVIVDRRNKIAHEADMDPANPGFRWPISDILASDALDFVDRVAEAIFKVAV